MYSILIVDDEPFVREGIKENIEWGKHGFELIGDCEDGRKAMAAVDKFKPDIVLTDICMPFVDGLELTQYILERYPQTKVVILTGYDEFEYAQQAVKLKAYDYILKPITANELRKILDKLKCELEEEAQKHENLNKLKKQLNESLPLLRERFLNRLIQGNVKNSEIEEKSTLFNINVEGTAFLAITVDIDDFGDIKLIHPEEEVELLHFAIFNISDEILSKYRKKVVFQNNMGKTVAIIAGDDPNNLHETAINLCDEIRQAIEKYLKFTVTIGIGKPVQSIADIFLSYKHAVSALEYRFMLGKNHVISINDLEGVIADEPVYNKEWERKLVSAVKIGTFDEIDNVTSIVIENLKKSYTSINKCHYQIQMLVLAIIGALYDLGVSENEVFGKDCALLTEIYNLKTLDETKKWLLSLLRKASNYLAGKRNDYCRDQANKAIEYIRERYFDTEISLDAICKHLLMSTSYFSSVFKNHAGQTFVEYLTKVRMEKAMELLKGTNMKTYEIALNIGYNDPHYFSLAFKKSVGCTPSEYRERI